VQTRRLADLFEPLNSSLAQSAEELWRWKGNRNCCFLGRNPSMNISYACSQSVKKCLIVEGSLGFNSWASKARENAYCTTNDIFYSGHLQHEHKRPDMEQKYMNSNRAQRKEPELTIWSGTVGGGTNVQSKQLRVLRYKS